MQLQTLSLIKTGRVSEKEVRYTDPRMIFDACRDMASLDREHFVVLHLDGKNRIVARETVSIGSLNQAIVHPREVFKAAVHNGSAAIICVHNHPSGDPEPSDEDKAITRRLCEAGDIVGINVLDHVIVGQDAYFSFIGAGYMGNHQACTVSPTPSADYTKELTGAKRFRALAGLLLKNLRNQAKMTQQNLFKVTGIRQSYLSSIETGWREISEKEAQELAAVFNIDYRMFLFNPADTSQNTLKVA